MRLNGKIALVTGAGSGIGEAIANQFVREGATVIVADIDLAGAENTLSQIKAQSPRSIAYKVDVAQEEQMKDLFETVAFQFERIDILINNAGIGVAAKVVDTSIEDWDRVMDVNVKGVYLGCKYVIPLMQKQGGGVIVNTASVAGEVGVYNRGAYCASKAAVLGLTKSVAIDYADDNIRCVAVSPGTVDSPWIGKILSNNPDPEGARKAMEARQPIGRMGSPDEIASAILFLASDEASFATGSNFIIDGGITAR